MQYLKRKGIPWMYLTDLQKLVDREVSLAGIVETVSYANAEKLDQSPPDYRCPSTLSSTMSRPLMPRRIPISSSTSTLSRLAAIRVPISALNVLKVVPADYQQAHKGGEISTMLFSQMQESSRGSSPKMSIF
jgi:hypothetical protein